MNVEQFNRQFHLSESQINKLLEWQDQLPDAYFGADSNGVSIIFHGCSIGQIVKAQRREGEEIDLTDWENF